jgi:uncharacterized protein (DUF697 family)
MPDAAALDKQILDASITNAALEILPETLASMAILPLQVRLVYRIGQAHGYELDQGHIKEFIAALGVGLAGQYLEQFGRKLLGGLLGSVLGGWGAAVSRRRAGMAFATAWALGQVAKQYGGDARSTRQAQGRVAPLLANWRSSTATVATSRSARLDDAQTAGADQAPDGAAFITGDIGVATTVV